MVWSERRRLLVALAGAAALLVVWLVYAPARHAVFVGEDHTLVRRDTRWQKAPVAALFTRPLWPESQTADVRVPHYKPATLASYRLDHALGGTATELHFTNVLLHAVACALLALVAARLGARGGAAVLAALAWAVAPRLSESVAWVSGRADVLAGTFGLAALALSPDVTARRPRVGAGAWVRALASAVLVFFALASNDTGLAFPLAIAAAALVPREGETVIPRARVLRAAASTLGPIAAFVALRAHALAGAATTVKTQADPGLAVRVATALEAIGRYAEMTLRATDPRTSIGAQGVLDVPRVVAGAAVVALVAFLVRRARGRGGIGAPAWIAGALAGAGIAIAIARGSQGAAGAVAADRLLYVPLAGLAIGLAVLAARTSARTVRVTSAAAIGIVVLFAAATKARAEDYRDEIGFWVEAAERAHPANAYARSSLAATVIEHGRTDLGCRLVAAARRIHEESGRTGTVGHRRAREAEATCLSRLGRLEEASRTFEELVRDNPEVARLHMGFAYVRLQLLDFDLAESEFARAVMIDPVLRTNIEKAVHELVRARAEAASFDTEEERRADRRGYASFLASVGRVGDAVREMTAIAEDDAQPPGARKSAVWFLANYGDVGTARRAGRLAYGEVLASMDEELLARREHRLAEVAAHEARIERLATAPGEIATR